MRRSLTKSIVVAAIVCVATTASALAQADLSLTFSGGPNGSGCGGVGTCGGGIIPIAPGGQAAYELIVRNNGPLSATSLVVTVTFPPKTSFRQFTPTTGWSCSSSIVSGNPTLTCTQATMANGSFSATTILIDLASDYPWEGGLSATASVTSATSDPNTTNNSVTVNLAVQAPITIPALASGSLMLLIAMLAVVGVVVMSRASA